MKRPWTLLIAAVLGTAYLVYIVRYFGTAVTAAAPDSSEQAGAAIATVMLMPHMIMVGIAVLFNWLGWACKQAGFALTGGILYIIGGALMIIYMPFVLVQAILSFVGYSQIKKRKAALKP